MGLLNPRNLAYLASLAVLVAIYLRARAKPTLEVSSLMLFDEIAAPVASSRVLRTDLMFWLEMAALGALSMALAGLYIRTRGTPAAHHQAHALIFDLGAGMGARERNGTRLDEARRQALEIVAAARAGDSFSVIGYALEATVHRAPTSHLADVRQAIDELKPAALAGAGGRDAGGADARARHGRNRCLRRPRAGQRLAEFRRRRTRACICIRSAHRPPIWRSWRSSPARWAPRRAAWSCATSPTVPQLCEIARRPRRATTC